MSEGRGRRAPLTAEQRKRVEDAKELVRRLAQHLIARRGVRLELDELLSLGNVGLVEAAEAFDPTAGTEFETFAWGRVRGAMLNGLHRERRARPPSLRQAERAADAYMEAQRHEGDVFADGDEQWSKRLEDLCDGAAASIFAGLVSEASRGEARMSDEARAAAHTNARAIAVLDHALGSLPERDRRLLELHYREERQLQEVAGVMSVSYATVRRFHKNAIDRLAVRLRARGIVSAPALDPGG